MHILQPRARRPNRHPPTDIYSPIVAGVLPSPCFPNFLARMLFLGATDVKQIGTLPKGWQLKSSIKSFLPFQGGGREGGVLPWALPALSALLDLQFLNLSQLFQLSQFCQFFHSSDTLSSSSSSNFEICRKLEELGEYL